MPMLQALTSDEEEEEEEQGGEDESPPPSPCDNDEEVNGRQTPVLLGIESPRNESDNDGSAAAGSEGTVRIFGVSSPTKRFFEPDPPTSAPPTWTESEVSEEDDEETEEDGEEAPLPPPPLIPMFPPSSPGMRSTDTLATAIGAREEGEDGAGVGPKVFIPRRAGDYGPPTVSGNVGVRGEDEDKGKHKDEGDSLTRGPQSTTPRNEIRAEEEAAKTAATVTVEMMDKTSGDETTEKLKRQASEILMDAYLELVIGEREKGAGESKGGASNYRNGSNGSVATIDQSKCSDGGTSDEDSDKTIQTGNGDAAASKWEGEEEEEEEYLAVQALEHQKREERDAPKLRDSANTSGPEDDVKVMDPPISPRSCDEGDEGEVKRQTGLEAHNKAKKLAIQAKMSDAPKGVGSTDNDGSMNTQERLISQSNRRKGQYSGMKVRQISEDDYAALRGGLGSGKWDLSSGSEECNDEEVKGTSSSSDFSRGSLGDISTSEDHSSSEEDISFKEGRDAQSGHGEEDVDVETKSCDPGEKEEDKREVIDVPSVHTPVLAAGADKGTVTGSTKHEKMMDTQSSREEKDAHLETLSCNPGEKEEDKREVIDVPSVHTPVLTAGADKGTVTGSTKHEKGGDTQLGLEEKDADLETKSCKDKRQVIDVLSVHTPRPTAGADMGTVTGSTKHEKHPSAEERVMEFFVSLDQMDLEGTNIEGELGSSRSAESTESSQSVDRAKLRRDDDSSDNFSRTEPGMAGAACHKDTKHTSTISTVEKKMTKLAVAAEGRFVSGLGSDKGFPIAESRDEMNFAHGFGEEKEGTNSVNSREGVSDMNAVSGYEKEAAEKTPTVSTATGIGSPPCHTSLSGENGGNMTSKMLEIEQEYQQRADKLRQQYLAKMESIKNGIKQGMQTQISSAESLKDCMKKEVNAPVSSTGGALKCSSVVDTENEAKKSGGGDLRGDLKKKQVPLVDNSMKPSEKMKGNDPTERATASSTLGEEGQQKQDKVAIALRNYRLQMEQKMQRRVEWLKSQIEKVHDSMDDQIEHTLEKEAKKVKEIEIQLDAMEDSHETKCHDIMQEAAQKKDIIQELNRHLNEAKKKKRSLQKQVSIQSGLLKTVREETDFVNKKLSILQTRIDKMCSERTTTMKEEHRNFLRLCHHMKRDVADALTNQFTKVDICYKALEVEYRLTTEYTVNLEKTIRNTKHQTGSSKAMWEERLMHLSNEVHKLKKALESIEQQSSSIEKDNTVQIGRLQTSHDLLIKQIQEANVECATTNLRLESVNKELRQLQRQHDEGVAMHNELLAMKGG